MRLKQKRLRPLQIRNRITDKDAEGVPVVTWGEPREVMGEVWSAVSRLTVEQYGDRASGIQNVWLEGEYKQTYEEGRNFFTIDGFTFTTGDGVCVESNGEPDYQIISITPYSHIKMEIERR